MKRKKLYIFISILTSIFLFSTAAICNQCAATPEEEKTVIEEGEEVGGEVTEEEEENEKESEETIEEKSKVTEEAKEEKEQTPETKSGDEPQDKNLASTKLRVEIYESGYLIRNEEVLHKYDFIQYVGDTDHNNPCKGFISYDITPLAGVTIESAILTLAPFRGGGDPSSFYPICLYATSWGTRSLTQSDFALAGILVGQSYSENIECTTDSLKDELQRAIDDGKDRFQLMFYFTGIETDSDNQWDGWSYSAQADDLGHFIINYIP